MLLRVAIYRRVSTGRQAAHGASLDEQLNAATDYAARMGWRIVADYCESGRSAYAEDLNRRPQFQAMRAAAERRAFDVVLVYELSRFGRRRKAFAVGEDLERLGIRLVSVTEAFDLSTVEGFVTYSILAMQAELSSRLLSRRMKAVRAGEAAAGEMMLRAPRGLCRDASGSVVPSPDAPLIVELFARAHRGETTDQLLRYLSSIGQPMARSTLHDLLTNPAYAGRQVHQGVVTPATWPALVEPAVFDAVQEQRATRRPSLPVRSTVRTPRPAMLAGLLFCGNCGAKLIYDHHDALSHYRCACRRNGGHCNERSTRADRIEQEAATLVASLVLPPDVREMARRLAAAPAPVVLHADPAAIRERLRRLARAYADGAYADAEYEAQRAVLEAQLVEATPPPVVDVERALRLLDDLPALWAGATSTERRTILGTVVKQIYTRRNLILAVRPTPLAEPAMVALWTGAMDGCWATDGRRPALLAA